MIFFSELHNQKVYTEDNVLVGWLDDILFHFKEIPTITKIIVRSQKLQHPKLYIPVSYIVSLGSDIIISKNYTIEYLKDNELYISKNVLNQQVIDIEGKKVVRVNDVVLKQTGTNALTILGVDVGLLGILRWIHLEDVFKSMFLRFGKKIVSATLPWSHIQPLELTEGKVRLNVHQDKLQDLHPEDLADYLEATSMDNIIQTINLLDLDFATEVVAELNLNYQITLFSKIGIKKTVAILSRMDPDEAVDVLSQYPTKKQAEILSRLDDQTRAEMETLLQMAQTEIGEFVTTEFMEIDSDTTASHVLEKVRQKGEDLSFLDHIYVTNKSSQLIGVFSLHELLLQSTHAPVRKFMIENPITVHLHTPLHSVARKIIKYKVSALPVVNEYKKIIGIVTFDDITQYFLEKI